LWNTWNFCCSYLSSNYFRFLVLSFIHVILSKQPKRKVRMGREHSAFFLQKIKHLKNLLQKFSCDLSFVIVIMRQNYFVIEYLKKCNMSLLTNCMGVSSCSRTHNVISQTLHRLRSAHIEQLTCFRNSRYLSTLSITSLCAYLHRFKSGKFKQRVLSIFFLYLSTCFIRLIALIVLDLNSCLLFLNSFVSK